MNKSHIAPLQINTQLLFILKMFHKIATGGHFGCQKVTFDRITRHFRSILKLFYIFFTKWLPLAILNALKSLFIAYLAISDQYVILILLDFFIFSKMGGSHFGRQKIIVLSHFSPEINTQLYFTI